MANQYERPKAKANEPSTDMPDDPNRFRRASATYKEAIAQGAVIQQSVDNEIQNISAIAKVLKTKRWKRIYILGCGDSWFVGMGVRLAFERILSVPTEAMQALDYALYFHETSDKDTLVIGISSGGNTPAVMEALRQAKKTGAAVVGVTNNENTPITKEFEHSIFVRATRKGWPTQASTATMAVLIRFAIELVKEAGYSSIDNAISLQKRLEKLPDIVSSTIQNIDPIMKTMAKELAQARFIFFCAGGPNFAPAAFGAAKVKELCPIHATAIPLEEFHHYRSLKLGDPLILIAPDETSHGRALDTAEVGRYDGGMIYAIVPEGEKEISEVAKIAVSLPVVDPLIAPILYSVPLHLFAYYLSMEKFNLGLGYTPAFPDSGT